MAEVTGIQWTDATFNPWRGCTKVSAGCQHCYAETQSKRNPKVLGEWGPTGKRVVAAESYWQQPAKWDRDAAAAGVRRRVFCASLADVFELNPQVVEARARLFRVIDSTPNLDWLLLTKRPENIAAMWHSRTYRDDAGREWGESKPTAVRFRRDNVWLGTTCEDLPNADRRLPHLKACRDLAAVLFVSAEPLIGPLVIPTADVDWVIVGGESGAGARPFDPDWARSLRDQCDITNTAFFFKQTGVNPVGLSVRHKGGEMDDIPEDLRIRQFPVGGRSEVPHA